MHARSVDQWTMSGTKLFKTGAMVWILYSRSDYHGHCSNITTTEPLDITTWGQPKWIFVTDGSTWFSLGKFMIVLRLWGNTDGHINCLVQDCSISSALAMAIMQFCTKPSICEMTSTKRQWVRLTGLTAVSQFKLRLPEHYASRTHHKGPSRMKT